MINERTPFMIARQAFFAGRTADVAKAYADAALAAVGEFGPGVMSAVATELNHAGFADDANRVHHTGGNDVPCK